MAIKQNAIDLAHEYPLVAEAVMKSFYVDDCLTGADDVKTVITLQWQLQDLFFRGVVLLRKWNSSESFVLRDIAPELHEVKMCIPSLILVTLGLEWNKVTDKFHLNFHRWRI